MSTNRWMDKEVVIHKYNGILLSHIMECISANTNEVDEHRAYYTEWSESEREKQVSHTNTYVDSGKTVLKNLPAGQQLRWRLEKRCVCGLSKGWVGWMEGEQGNRCPTMCTQRASGSLLDDSGNSHWGSVTTYRSGMGWGVGGRLKRELYMYLWLIHVDVWPKSKQYCKAIILWLKINKNVRGK